MPSRHTTATSRHCRRHYHATWLTYLWRYLSAAVFVAYLATVIIGAITFNPAATQPPVPIEITALGLLAACSLYDNNKHRDTIRTDSKTCIMCINHHPHLNTDTNT